MALMAGDKCKVYIETPDGRMLEAQAYAVSISVDSPEITTFSDKYPMMLRGMTKSTIELSVIGEMIWRFQDDWEKTVEKRQLSNEWQCDYCGRPNSKVDEACKSCGAVRSFVYG